MKYTTFAAVGALVLLAGIAEPQSRRVSVTVTRLMQIDNLDKDFIKADRADFYGRIWIGGKVKQTKTFISDDGNPRWTVSQRVTGSRVAIRIKIADDDGGLEDRDDQVDICPKDGKKELDLVLDTRTGRISGDVTGRRGQTLHVKGGNDGDKAEIWFVIR